MLGEIGAVCNRVAGEPGTQAPPVCRKEAARGKWGRPVASFELLAENLRSSGLKRPQRSRIQTLSKSDPAYSIWPNTKFLKAYLGTTTWVPGFNCSQLLTPAQTDHSGITCGWPFLKPSFPSDSYAC